MDELGLYGIHYVETAYGDLTSDTGSLPLGPIQNSNAGGFGLLEPSLHWEHEDAMQALDLAYEGNIDEASFSFTHSSWLSTSSPNQDIHEGKAQYDPPDDQAASIVMTEIPGAAPYDKHALGASPKLPTIDDEVSEHKQDKTECPFQPCSFQYRSRDNNYRQHIKTAHPFVYTCNECGEKKDHVEALSIHATQYGHLCFPCNHPDCDRAFSRVDTYKRHMREHLEDAKRFSCKYCKKYRGKNGFKRKDHLTQHLRGYHHIEAVEKRQNRNDARNNWKGFCKHPDCSESQGERNFFDSKFKRVSDFTKHMKTIHNESEFPCPEPGCDRVGGKGYFRHIDLRKHIEKVHGTIGKTIEGAD